jgi:anti-sigma B factor antagonist
VVLLAGELDLNVADQAESAIRAVEAAGAKTVVLDLRELRFMDSTGLRVILAADARARREGWMLSLVPGPDAVHRVFRMALLDQRLDFVEPDALDADA